MKVTVNGRPLELDAEASVRDAAVAVGIEPEDRGVAIALDGEVVPRSELDSTRLCGGESLEIVAAIQGGAR